ncbi:MAG: hypothetical protein U0354_18520 [Candidatus Sericytochromatia bacterium]
MSIVISEIERGLTKKLQEFDFENETKQIKSFSYWIIGKDNNFPFDIKQIASESVETKAAQRSYQDLSSIGFSLDYISDKDPLITSLKEGLLWIKGRKFSEESGFHFDSIAKLGLSIGLSFIEDEWNEKVEIIKMLQGFIEYSLQNIRVNDFDKSLLNTSKIFLNKIEISPSLFNPTFFTFLVSKGIVNSNENLEDEFLKELRKINIESCSLPECAISLSALKWLQRDKPIILPERATLKDVCNILSRVQNSFNRWCWEEKARSKKKGAIPIKWEISSEYHVQDLLWVILAPIFPDLISEENLPSFGQKHPRYDLGIPSLKLIIEVKFIYDGTKSEFSNIIEGIAADTSLYLSDKEKYSSIIAFVWDNSRKTEQYSEFKQGLDKVNGLSEVIIIPRPGKMEINK